MTDTRQQISQAIRELHIDIEPYAREVSIEASVEQPGTYSVFFRNRKGIDSTVSIPMDADYRSILLAIKDSWRG